jgi:hypothetical protein
VLVLPDVDAPSRVLPPHPFRTETADAATVTLRTGAFHPAPPVPIARCYPASRHNHKDRHAADALRAPDAFAKKKATTKPLLRVRLGASWLRSAGSYAVEVKLGRHEAFAARLRGKLRLAPT